MKTNMHAAKGNPPLVKVEDQTSHGTGGTRSEHAHGLTDWAGNAVTPDVAIPVIRATDADGGLSATSVHVVSMDSTNVTVRASANSVNFDLYVG